MIRDEFGMSDTRHAVIHGTGFLCFDDEGEDVSQNFNLDADWSGRCHIQSRESHSEKVPLL